MSESLTYQGTEPICPETPCLFAYVIPEEFTVIPPENSHASFGVRGWTNGPVIIIFTAEAPIAELDPAVATGDASVRPDRAVLAWHGPRNLLLGELFVNTLKRPTAAYSRCFSEHIIYAYFHLWPLLVT